MATEHSKLPDDWNLVLVSVFAHAIGVVDKLAPFETVGPESFEAMRKELGFLKESLESVGKWIGELPRSVKSDVEAIGAIVNEATCNVGFGDVCLSFLNSDIKAHGERGWREAIRLTKPTAIPWAKSAQQPRKVTITELESTSVSLNGAPEPDSRIETDSTLSPDGMVAELEAETPAFDQNDCNWVKNTKAAELDSVETATLRNYRQKGIKNACSTIGRDRDGRVWRRPGTPSSHPWYLRKTLKSEQQ